jgi:Pvc16 N-terminal domain
MLIPLVEQGLEKLVRTALPLPEQVGGVSFDPPSRTWAAQLSQITVSMFLFGIGRSAQPPRPVPDRTGSDGQLQRRRPVPMIELNYLVSAWAGNVRDEHELLGDVLGCFLTHQMLPTDLAAPALLSTVQIALAPTDSGRIKDVFASVDGAMRACFEVVLTTALDTGTWADAAPRVQRIEALTAPVPAPARPAPVAGWGRSEQPADQAASATADQAASATADQAASATADQAASATADQAASAAGG